MKSNNQTQMRNSGAFPTRTSENRVRLAKRATQLACLVLVAGFPIGCVYHAHRGSTLSTAPADSKAAQTAGQPAASDAVRRSIAANYGKLPLSFEANQGQTDAQVKFLSRGSGYSLFLTPTEAVFSLRKPYEKSAGERDAKQPSDPVVLRAQREKNPPTEMTSFCMKLLGANRAPAISGVEELPGKSHYFKGNDPKQWRTDVPHYRKVKYKEVYPGVDLVYYGNQRRLEYDLIVAPGADPTSIQMQFEGATKLELDNQGHLIVHLGSVAIRQHKPFIFQEVNGHKNKIEGAYILKASDKVAFELAQYDTGHPLTIDPVLEYSTFLGGSGEENSVGIAVDASGNAYVTGYVFSADFPIVGAVQATFGGGENDAFVAKIDATGTALVYSSYLGGLSSSPPLGVVELGRRIAVDAAGNAYVAGQTDAPDFPTTVNAFQTVYGGATGGSFSGDAFLTILDPSGSALIYSTYLGGSQLDRALGLAVDASGLVYVTGDTGSVNFPTANALQSAFGGGSDGFVAKIDPSQAGAASLMFSTYLGGSGGDSVSCIALDAVGNLVLAGGTSSPNFPVTANAFQATLGGASDAYVATLNPMGTALGYTTYLGGTSIDGASDIAVDSAGDVYLAGSTRSSNFPLANAFQATFGGGNIDAFVAKLNLANSTLLYSTFLGGSGDEVGSGIAIDTSGTAAITGFTRSLNFPTTADAWQTASGGSSEAYVTLIDPFQTGTASLLFSTYLGGAFFESGQRVAVDAPGNFYVTGEADSPDFPTTPGAVQPVHAGSAGTGDAFLLKLSREPSALVEDLVSRVVTLNLQAGIANSLDAKLDAALDALADSNQNNDVATINSLQAFINSVEAQRGKKITEADADMLIATSNQIILRLSQ